MIKDNSLINLPKLHHCDESALPKVSVIIPTCNCAQWMTVTLDSLLHQEYPDLEIIIIDARSTDRTVEFVKNFCKEGQCSVYSVSSTKRFEMINAGLAHCLGTYINILLPGDFYLHSRAVKTMMSLAHGQSWPDLVYCGSVVHGRDGCGTALYHPFSLDLLRRGHQPTNLRSCWIHRELFRKIGKFSVDYQRRGALDFMGRIALDPSLKVAETTQVLTDSDRIEEKHGFKYYWETVKVLWKLFGWHWR